MPKTGEPKKEEKLKTVLEYIGPEFVESGARRIGPDEVATVITGLDKIEESFHTNDALRRHERQGKLMIDLLRDFEQGKYSTTYWNLALVTFGLQYVLTPVDIIPDTLPVIGQLDDAMVIAHCVELLDRELQAYKVWKLAEA